MPVSLPLLSLAALALIAASPAPAPPPAPPHASTSPLEGTWRNMRDTIHLRAARCGAAVCGTVISAAARHQADAEEGSGRSLIGMQLFRDFRPADRATWKGMIYIPDLDRDASGKIVLTDRNSITVSGCLLAGLVCKTQHWKRIS